MQGKAFIIQNEQEQWIAVTHFMTTSEWCYGGDRVYFSWSALSQQEMQRSPDILSWENERLFE